MEEELSLSERFRAMVPAAVGTIAQNILTVSLVVAFLATAYLLIGLFGGSLNGFGTQNAGDKARILSNIGTASSVLGLALGIAAISAALVFFAEESVGYALVLAALTVGMGIPFLYGQFFAQGASPNRAIQNALDAFNAASRIPLFIGAALVVRDIIGRLSSGLTAKPSKKQNLSYGKDAVRENRQRLLGKCYEGPFCRDFVRVHCPIFQQKKACWTIRRGCYCEEDIVSNAAAKVSGVHLSMAPDAASNFANPANPLTAAPTDPQVTLVRGGNVMGSMTGAPPATPIGNPLHSTPESRPVADILSPIAASPDAQPIGNPLLGSGSPGFNPLQNTAGPRRVELSWKQKKERCNNCVIYNEHQKEKYQVLMPLTMLGTVAAAFVFNQPIRAIISKGLAGFQNAMSLVSFTGANVKQAQPADPSLGVEWFLFGVIVIILMSKALQGLEWAMFKAKI